MGPPGRLLPAGPGPGAPCHPASGRLGEALRFTSRGKELVSRARAPDQGPSGVPAARVWVRQGGLPSSCTGPTWKPCGLPDPPFMMPMGSDEEEAEEEMLSSHRFPLFVQVTGADQVWALRTLPLRPVCTQRGYNSWSRKPAHGAARKGVQSWAVLPHLLWRFFCLRPSPACLDRPLHAQCSPSPWGGGGRSPPPFA